MSEEGGRPFIGCRITLISKSDIRYEGTLHDIDAAKATVALRNVRSFGSEDRPVDSFIPPSSEVYSFIEFRGSDIKDLHVLDTSQQSEPTLNDPAIISAEPKSEEPATTASSESAKPKSSEGGGSWARVARGGSSGSSSRGGPRGRGRPRGSSARPGTGKHLLAMPERGSGGIDGPESTEGEFDFEASMNEFDKNAEMKKLQDDETGGKEEVEPKYTKNDFFDSISCDALDREGGSNPARLRREEERRLNRETFGAVGLNENRYRGGYRGRGRGRGRGGSRGRGGYRGRGRGGHRGGNSDTGNWRRAEVSQ